MSTDTPVEAIASLVAYNWNDEEGDYNHEALEEGNSREGHIFESLKAIQRWLETCHGYPHVEPRITDEETAARERLEYLRGELRGERISYGELIELQNLAPYIEAGDTELLEAAGVPEFPEDTADQETAS